MAGIKFGTEGWRALVAETFTFENVRIVAQALSDYICSQGLTEKGIALSYDTRFMSEQFAQQIAEVISSNSIPVFLSNSFTPTPVLSYAVKERALAGGVMVTASHNPYYYNGIKFKSSYGGPALSDTTQAIEQYLYKTPPRHETTLIKKNIYPVDFLSEYYKHILGFVDFDAIRSFKGTIIYNPMYGAGIGILNNLLRDTNLSLININADINPSFKGKSPEPILKNMLDLQTALLEKGAVLGLATDGDADRFGVIEQNGQFVELHDLMPLLFQHLVESRKWEGEVVRTTSMANTVDKIASEYGRTVIEVPVGFKNVSEKMLENNILIGGEESGGFGYKNNIPERDGILSGLLLIEMLAAKKTNLTELVKELRQKYGPFFYGRIDKYGDSEILQGNLKALKASPPERVSSFEVQSVNLLDGIKFYFSNDSWMLMRLSQTEPLGRIYVGATTPEIVQQLLRTGEEMLIDLLPECNGYLTITTL